MATTTYNASPVASSCHINATATDAGGNVFVTGTFIGQATFGNTVLASTIAGAGGSEDLFVAKYVPATGTWAWAVRGGGTGSDLGYGIAVSGTNVYITGTIASNTADVSAVTFQQTSTGTGATSVLGATTSPGTDVVVAKYTDNGASATLGWVQVAGGSGYDSGHGIAVSGNSVYVTGSLYNSTTNANGVLLGGHGTTVGTVLQYGATATAGYDLFVTKYTDNGNEAVLNWTQIGGGTDQDQGNSIAVVGNKVYVTGYLTNDLHDGEAAVFGGSGTTAGTVLQYGATANISRTMITLKYVDAGPTATVAWSQVGGTHGNAIAVSGTSVYVTGWLGSSPGNTAPVLFGGTGTTPGTVAQYGARASSTGNNDWMLVKYTDNGPTATVAWTQVAGGSDSDLAFGLAVSGQSVFVTGIMYNNAANVNAVLLGGAGSTPGTAMQPGATPTTSSDLVVAKYTDNGPSATLNWSQVGGGAGPDYGTSLAVSSTALCVGGWATLPVTFGSYTYNPGGYFIVGVLAAFNLNSALATAASTAPSFTLYPNPASGAAHLSGAAPTTTGQVLDALGRQVATFRTDATGAATLPTGLAPGIYAVRIGAVMGRLAVQ